jgi:histidinol-phosphate phosphatase family protein
MISKPHLFLDRDGTLIREEHYLRDPTKVFLETGVIEGLKLFQKLGYCLVVVSNQSGIGRGLITEQDVISVNQRVSYLLALNDIYVSSWRYCPHMPDQNCECRKPKTGMLLEWDTICPVNFRQSLIIGDKPSDVQAGISLGMTSALVTTGYGHLHKDWARSNSVLIFDSLLDFANYIANSNNS